jgi:hypothetical protein
VRHVLASQVGRDETHAVLMRGVSVGAPTNTHIYTHTHTFGFCYCCDI